MAPSYDAWMTMGYWTNRKPDSGYRDAYRYTRENIDRLRVNLGNPDAIVHPIGGLAAETAPAHSTPSCGPRLSPRRWRQPLRLAHDRVDLAQPAGFPPLTRPPRGLVAVDAQLGMTEAPLRRSIYAVELLVDPLARHLHEFLA